MLVEVTPEMVEARRLKYLLQREYHLSGDEVRRLPLFEVLIMASHDAHFQPAPTRMEPAGIGDEIENAWAQSSAQMDAEMMNRA